MDKQLKACAQRVRAERSNVGHPITHSQSLDIAASIGGRRNWPEWQALGPAPGASPLSPEAGARLMDRLNATFSSMFLTPASALVMAVGIDGLGQLDLAVPTSIKAKVPKGEADGDVSPDSFRVVGNTTFAIERQSGDTYLSVRIYDSAGVLMAHDLASQDRSFFVRTTLGIWILHNGDSAVVAALPGVKKKTIESLAAFSGIRILHRRKWSLESMDTRKKMILAGVPDSEALREGEDTWPFKDDADYQAALETLRLASKPGVGIVLSGEYELFFELDGKHRIVPNIKSGHTPREVYKFRGSIYDDVISTAAWQRKQTASAQP